MEKGEPGLIFEGSPGDDAFVGVSPAFKAVLRMIVRIASCEANTLIQGETGTGKELAARAIHYMGVRRDHPFVPVNCGAITDTLFESEMFGYVKGAFTDAKISKRGVVAYADGGTLFLDEIECLSPKGQATLLRFLQDQTYRPIGGPLIKGNVRVIAASNRELDKLAKLGEFRQDLFYRLNLLTFTMPPLRERAGDPAILAKYFISQGSQRFRVPLKTIHASTLSWFDRYSWPGNVRELENLIYREMLLSDSSEIRFHIDETETLTNQGPMIERRHPIWLTMPYQSAKSHVIHDFERLYLIKLLQQTKGNISAAARLAGKERRSFDRLLQKNLIDKFQFRD